MSLILNYLQNKYITDNINIDNIQELRTSLYKQYIKSYNDDKRIVLINNRKILDTKKLEQISTGKIYQINLFIIIHHISWRLFY